MLRNCFSALVLSLLSASAFAMPAQIVVLRHGEKPEIGNQLSERGFERARRLPALFHSQRELFQFGAPAALYAARPNDNDGSVRMIQTLEPLGRELHLSVNQQYGKKEFTALAYEISHTKAYDGKTVVICWHGDHIDNVMRAFGYANSPQWPSKRFDRIWILRFHGDEPSVFINLPQKLFDDDSEL